VRTITVRSTGTAVQMYGHVTGTEKPSTVRQRPSEKLFE